MWGGLLRNPDLIKLTGKRTWRPRRATRTRRCCWSLRPLGLRPPANLPKLFCPRAARATWYVCVRMWWIGVCACARARVCVSLHAWASLTHTQDFARMLQEQENNNSDSSPHTNPNPKPSQAPVPKPIATTQTPVHTATESPDSNFNPFDEINDVETALTIPVLSRRGSSIDSSAIMAARGEANSWDYFLSHVQAESGPQTIFYFL